MLWKRFFARGNHLNIVKQKCLMVAKGVMKIFLEEPLYIYITNLLAKAISLPERMIVTSRIKALPDIVHARSHEQDKPDEPKLGSTTHANEERVETNSEKP